MVEVIALYRSKTWKINKKDKRELHVVEVDVIRRSCRVSKLEHISNIRI